jgi:hypothetical protein
MDSGLFGPTWDDVFRIAILVVGVVNVAVIVVGILALRPPPTRRRAVRARGEELRPRGCRTGVSIVMR